VQHHSSKAGHDYGQHVREARNPGREEIATFFEQVMSADSQRAKRCHDFLSELSGTKDSGPALTSRGDDVALSGVRPAHPGRPHTGAASPRLNRW
jgi:hypothetical protein